MSCKSLTVSIPLNRYPAKSGPSTITSQLSSLHARSSTTNNTNTNNHPNDLSSTHPTTSSNSSLPAKLAKNKRLPATMITPSGTVDTSKKKNQPRKANGQVSKKQRKRLEMGKEKALERSIKLDEKVKGREVRKVGVWPMASRCGMCMVGWLTDVMIS